MEDAVWESLAWVLGKHGAPVGVAFAFGRPGILLTGSSIADAPSLSLRAWNGEPLQAVVRAGHEGVVVAEGGRLLPLVGTARAEPLAEASVGVWLPALDGGTSLSALPGVARQDGEHLFVELVEPIPEPLRGRVTGAPVLDGNGVVGVVLEASAGDRFLRALSLRAFPALASLLAPPQQPTAPRRGRWIRVTGTYRPGDTARILATELGRALANAGFGLIHGGSTGIDELVREGFVSVATAPVAVQAIGAPGWGMHVQPRPDEVVRGFEAEVDPETFAGDALVVLAGGIGTVGVIERTRAAGRPVLPVPPSGRAAAELAQQLLRDWETLGPPGLDRAAFEALADADASTAIGQVLAILDRLFPQAPSEPRLPARILDPTAVNDNAEGNEDLLDVERDIERFARLIAAADLAPPLAIGLFGEWGSGKSFFIDHLHDRIEGLCPIEGPAVPGMCGDICQIRFNAWHYADVDLWGALAARVFDRLAEDLSVRKSTEAAQERAVLQDSLKWVEKERTKARLALAEAKAEAEQARAEAAAKEAARAAEVDSLRVWLDKRAWEKLAAEPEGAEAIAAAREKAEELGLAQVFDDARDTAKGFDGLVREAASVWTAIHALVRRPRGWLEWGMAGLLVLLPLVTAGLLAWKPEVVSFAVVAEGLGALLYGVKRVGTWLQSMRALVGEAQSLDDRARKARYALIAAGDDATRKARKALSDAETELISAQQKVDDLDAAVARTSEALVQLDPKKLVYDFVEARSRSDAAYRRTEGVVSMLRRDLEELSKRLKDTHREDARKRAPGPTVRRVVLYVDDLDRCPPAQVVAVLQAVHLLLAFDLFVVVLAVDPRWLERALEDHYRAIFRSEGGAAADLSAHDYLEKIFQIPFTLAPVDERGFAKLIGANLPFEEPEPPKTPDPAPAPTVVPPPARVSGSSLESAPESVPPGGATPPESPPAPVDITRRFVIARHEQEALLPLHGFIGTPRATKRFINVYRLLRASVEESQFRAFLATEHRVVQVLLAVTIGYPRTGALLLRELLTEPHPGRETWEQFLGRFEARPLAKRADEAERARLVYALHALKGLPPEISPYRRWARRVGRFSFLWSWDPLPPAATARRWKRVPTGLRAAPPVGTPSETPPETLQA